MKAAVYIRVSTADQNSELQWRELTNYAERQGWEIAEVFEDTNRRRQNRSPGSR